MATAEQITRYRAEDGTLFDTQAAAERHEAKERLGAIFNRVSAYGDVSVDSAVDVLVENAAEVIRLLQAV